MPEQQFLLMSLDGTQYALALEAVDELLRMVALAPKRDAPGWLLGYLNVRGEILPALDLRALLQMQPAVIRLETPIVVIRAGAQRAALVVDEVSQVVPLDFGANGQNVSHFAHQPVFLLEPGRLVAQAHQLHA